MKAGPLERSRISWHAGISLSFMIGISAISFGGVMDVRADQRRADLRCSYHGEQRRCAPSLKRTHKEERRSGYGYTYGRPKAEFYPFGSAEWWEAMEGEGRVFNGPN